ncbi:aminopeptidase P family protein [Wenjunlia tyrosinilytica]|uniref:Xaa-Pro aminopeptidase n=1 Tax=Wenjunlia tyrosinilytica TaxID=1544741 RepID=A0A918DX59_9ACTN|nr:aminopeptidase P family protein [Wenjunlia tyrosinilytica]GGO86451.1 Xaa-Pro aminopeptidase 1 [Wenjunlia tyrosinilytica]
MTEDHAAQQSETLDTGEQEQPIKGRKNGLYPEVSPQLADLMKSGWADTELRDLEPIEQAGLAAERRARLSARFPGERLIVPAGNLRTRSNDTEYPFRASCDYVYLTGDQTQDAVLVMEPSASGGHEATAYLLPRSNRENGEFWLDGQGELWVGRRHSLAEAERLLGLPCRDVRKAGDEIKAAAAVPTRIVRGHDAALEAVVAEITGPSEDTEERDRELKTSLDELRLVKDEWEIGELQKAVDSTVRGFHDVVAVLDKATSTSERYIEGTFFLRARVEGNDVGYGTIAASGAHACTLHWVRNDGPVNPGDLLLLDAGVETRTLYTADVTRTLPVDGTFTDVQRRVYDAVYEAQEAGIAAVKPGAAYRDFHDASQRVLAEKLVEWGLIEGPVERVLELGLQRRYSLHGTGHMLGLDVHDCAVARTETYVDGTLEPGMVLTVEPGLYFQSDDLTVPQEYRGIGVRIEDDILVTADGNRNLSADLPRRGDEVEAWVLSLRPSDNV